MSNDSVYFFLSSLRAVSFSRLAPLARPSSERLNPAGEREGISVRPAQLRGRGQPFPFSRLGFLNVFY